MNPPSPVASSRQVWKGESVEGELERVLWPGGIEAIILEKPIEKVEFKGDTMAVVRRRLLYSLDLDFSAYYLGNSPFGIYVFELCSIKPLCEHRRFFSVGYLPCLW